MPIDFIIDQFILGNDVRFGTDADVGAGWQQTAAFEPEADVIRRQD
jgi:hypothetical protein